MASKSVRGKNSTKHADLSTQQQMLLGMASKITASIVAKEGYKFPVQITVTRAVQVAQLLLDKVEQSNGNTPLYKVEVRDDSLACRVASQLIRKGLWFELSPTVNSSCQFTVHHHDADKLRALANSA